MSNVYDILYLSDDEEFKENTTFTPIEFNIYRPQTPEEPPLKKQRIETFENLIKTLIKLKIKK